MTDQSAIGIIRTIKKANENIMITIGVTVGMILLAYFFTFAQFIDRGYSGAAYFQGITSILLVIALIFLRRLSFAMTRLVYGRRAAYKPLLDSIGPADLGKDEKTLLERFSP